ALDELGGELPRVRTERLRELHGDVERPVAVVAVLGTLERDILGRDLDRVAASAERLPDDGEHGGGEFGWGHESRFYRAWRDALRAAADALGRSRAAPAEARVPPGRRCRPR